MLHGTSLLPGLSLIVTLFLAAPGLQAQSLVPAGQFVWQPDQPHFGGLSGLIISDGGGGIQAISDRGTLFRARILRDATGQIREIVDLQDHPLLDAEGNLPAPFLENAEAMAGDGADGLFIAYEGWARVWHYAAPGDLPTWTHGWDRFWDMIGNHGFEALARDAAGVLYAMSEQEQDGRFPVWRYDGTVWLDAFTLPARDGFLISGADFGPDGALYVVERRFRFLSGFDTRIRRYQIGPDGVREEALLLDSRGGELGNAEGLSVWVRADGTLHLSLISDDNFSILQTTRISEFIVPD